MESDFLTLISIIYLSKPKIAEFSKEINTDKRNMRFMYKEKDKPGCYEKMLKKKIPRRVHLQLIKR